MLTRAVLVIALATAALGLDHDTPVQAAPPRKAALENGEFTARLNGLQLWYRVSGQGPVCLMPAPGWGPSSDLYFRTLKSLEKTFTIVYFDTRGTGRSERPKAATEYTWAHLVADLDALRAHLKQDRVWMMGHSEGGMQILHYACRYPSRVSGLILLATKAAIRPGDAQAALVRAMRRKDEPWFPEVLKAYQAGPPKTDEEMAAQQRKLLPVLWADPARMEKHQEHFAAASMSVDAWRGTQTSRSQGFDLTEELKKVKAPALIIVGDKDLICPPAAAREIHLCLPNSKLLLIEDCGHFPWIEQAEEFNAQAPRFLPALGLAPPQ